MHIKWVFIIHILSAAQWKCLPWDLLVYMRVCLVVMWCPYHMLAMTEDYTLTILWHPGKISLSTRCKKVNNLADFVVSTLVGSTFIKHDNTIMVGPWSKNIVMHHSRYMTGTSSICVTWNLWLKWDRLITSAATKHRSNLHRVLHRVLSIFGVDKYRFQLCNQ